MIDLVLTIDSESTKRWVDGEVVHEAFERDVWSQCLALDRLAALHQARLTFFFPLRELAASDRRAGELARRLAERHELGVHLHRPFAAWSRDAIGELLAEERSSIESTTGGTVISVRAGGYNTGDQAAWIEACAQAGIRIDSSVLPGAATESSWESAQAARHDAAIWGGGGIEYDYRGAPVGGLYRAAPDSLVCPGEGPLLEAPIAAAFYDEREPRPFVLDAHGMSGALLVRSLEALAAAGTGRRPAAVVLLHSYGLFHGSHPTVVGRRVEELLRWAKRSGARIRTLEELAGEDPAAYGPLYALEQPERWAAADRRELVALLRRCPRCAHALAELRCPNCGWEATVLDDQLVDARPEPVEAFVPGPPPGRAGRYFRAGLAISGGALAVGAGNAAHLYARTRHRAPRD